jgi:hypothetical protein
MLMSVVAHAFNACAPLIAVVLISAHVPTNLANFDILNSYYIARHPPATNGPAPQVFRKNVSLVGNSRQSPILATNRSGTYAPYKSATVPANGELYCAPSGRIDLDR